MPRISVVVPTYQRLQGLQCVLHGLARQSLPASEFEVVVISDGCTDGTSEYLLSDEVPLPIVPLVQPNGGPAAARNAGIARATGEYVLFLDDDVVPSSRLVAAHLQRHDSCSGPTVVIGPMLSPPGRDLLPWVAWEQAMLYKQYAAMERGEWAPTARQFYTGNASLKRQHVLDAGGFDETFRRAEDVELAYRLDDMGMKFAYEPGAAGYHYADRSFESWRNIADAYGRNDVKFARDQGRQWILERLVDEFSTRNPLTRHLVVRCLPDAALAETASRAMRSAAAAAAQAGLRTLSRYALSAIYQLAYYRGASAELGGNELSRMLRAVL